MSAPLLTSSAAFTPRKEFQRTNNATHQFAFLAFNSTDILRLSSFPADVHGALRKVFEDLRVYRAFREDTELNVAEFTVADKAWTGKGTRTERLVTLIFSAILSHGWKVVTNVAYGRLERDTCSIVFSKELPPVAGSTASSNNPSTFTNPGGAPLPKQPPTDVSPPDPNTSNTTFALSFSTRWLRVVRPPKNCTPAILASVRNAWPRGIVSEGRPEDDVYEFQLKSGSLFSSSTFDRDALNHMFNILRSLDSHSLQLITNLTLTPGIAKSRNKDLWIFSAPADPPSPDLSPPTVLRPPGALHDSPSNSITNIPVRPTERDPTGTMSVASGPGVAGIGAGYQAYFLEAEGARHIRAATTPEDPSKGPGAASTSASGHARSATAPNLQPAVIPSPSSPSPSKPSGGMFQSLLRKPPPAPALSVEPKDAPPTRLDTTGFDPVMVSPRMPEPQPYPDGQAPNYQNTHLYASSPSSAYSPQQGSSDTRNLTTLAAAAGMAGTTVYQGHQAAQTAAVHRDDDRQPMTPTSAMYSESSEDARLLHGDAFRSSNYSITTEGARIENGGRSTMALHDEADPNRTPRMGSTHTRTGEVFASQNVGEHTMAGGGADGGRGSLDIMRRKSEKALLSYIANPAPDVPPLPSSAVDQRQQYPSPPTYNRMESGSTILPPGGFPRSPAFGSPSGSSQGHGNPLDTPQQTPKTTPPVSALTGIGSKVGGGSPISKMEAAILGANHRRTTSQGTQRSTGTARSRRPQSPGDGSMKGWVLVNVEPRGLRPSNSIGHSQDHHTHVRNQSETSQTAPLTPVSNVRVNDPLDSAHATAPVDEGSGASGRRVRLAADSPTVHNVGDDTDPDHPHTDTSAVDISSAARRKGSLRKKRPPPPTQKSSDDGSIGRKGIFKLFGGKKKQKQATVVTNDAAGGTTDEADTDGDPTNTPVGTTRRGKRQTTA